MSTASPAIDIRALDHRIRSIAQRRLPGRRWHHLRDEVSVEALDHILTHALAKFDPLRRDAKGRPIRIALWLDVCARNYINARLRTLLNREGRQMLCESQAPQASPHSRHAGEPDDGPLGRAMSDDTLTNAAIERAAARIIEHPERYLTPPQVIIFRALLDAAPGTTHQAIAQRLGYAEGSSFANIFRRLRDRLAGLDFEELAFGESQRGES